MKEPLTNIRTDLAVEAREIIEDDDKEISGVELEKYMLYGEEIEITKVRILNEHGEKIMGKPCGNYITIEARDMRDCTKENCKHISEALTGELSKLMCNTSKKKILIVGLGNMEATPDALGPRVVKRLNICERVYAVAPGVMAQTGMETAEYILALVKELKPGLLIAVDALAARNVSRLNTTIQISDAGICPGSGVGNHRKEISEKTVGIPVIAIGVPTVVDAATIVGDAMDRLIEELAVSEDFRYLKNSIAELLPHEKYRFIKEILEPAGGDMYVTPKDIDENVKNISIIISDAINRVVKAGGY